jgi:hypothetical protein
MSPVIREKFDMRKRDGSQYIHHGLRITFLSICLIFSSCGYFSNPSDEVVAKVDDKIYMLKDIQTQFPAGMTKADSLARVNDILTRWVKKELWLRMAEENLDEGQKDLTKELEEYRNSLLIHRYQQQLLNQKLDTSLTDEDIRRYYNVHPEKFTLEYDIVKAVYVEIPRELVKTDQIKRWMSENTSRSMSELESYSFQYASKYDHFNNDWVDFNTILARIPGIKDQPEKLLRDSKFHQFSNLNNYYFILINDYILAGEKAPFDFVKDRIESLILNSRKMDFLQELEKSIYEKGRRENRFTIKEFK